MTPGNTAVPTIPGTAQADQKLTESHGSWIPKSPTGYTYQWQDCDASGANCSSVAGATSQSYTPINADVGHALAGLESATSSGVTSSPGSRRRETGVVPGSPVVATASGYGGASNRRLQTGGSTGGRTGRLKRRPQWGRRLGLACQSESGEDPWVAAEGARCAREGRNDSRCAEPHRLHVCVLRAIAWSSGGGLVFAAPKHGKSSSSRR